MQDEQKPTAGLNDYLANERTFLSWIRTGVAIMAFGFVVSKFSLFIRQLSVLTGHQLIFGFKGYAMFTGSIILLIGAVIIPLSYYRYLQITRQLNHGQYTNNTRLPLILTVLVSSITLALLIYTIATAAESLSIK